MQDKETTERPFGFLHFVIFVVPFASLLSVGFFYLRVFFARLGLLGYFFALLIVVGFILFVCDQFNRKSK